MNLSVDCQLTIDYKVLVTRGAVLEKAIEETESGQGPGGAPAAQCAFHLQ